MVLTIASRRVQVAASISIDGVQVAAPISIFRLRTQPEPELSLVSTLAVQKSILTVLDVYSACVNFTYHLSSFCPEWPFL